ncbi:hypothetical protein [Clostridium tyrobutyricum]|uniref:hypothetical protein n=1 Tax=Clostridium tyrobutyricum TaxID=1519 RepID=UPI000ADA7A5B|nr:hypothetical protein [Clostridium tyrobutyricum]
MILFGVIEKIIYKAFMKMKSRYIVYHSRIFTPKIGYAIVKAINPQGILSLVRRKKL